MVVLVPEFLGYEEKDDWQLKDLGVFLPWATLYGFAVRPGMSVSHPLHADLECLVTSLQALPSSTWARRSTTVNSTATVRALQSP